MTTTVLNSTSIFVAWKRPEHMVESVKVEYEVQYTSRWNDVSVQILAVENKLGKDKDWGT